MRLVIDSSVWIDLEKGGLLDEAFRLPVEWLAPDLLVQEELSQPCGEDPVARGLMSLELSPEQVAEVQALRQKYKGPGTHDGR